MRSRFVRHLPWAEKFIDGLFKDRGEGLVMDVVSFCVAVVNLRVKHQFSVTSWGRTVKRNEAVGGVPGSDHLMFLGMDVVLEPMGKNLAFEQDCGAVGLSALFEKDHYHLRPR